jgi:MSHA pilin protein MshA
MSGAVKSSHAIAIADLKRFPSVIELASYVKGEDITATVNGVRVAIDGTRYTVPTYSDAACHRLTTAPSDSVQCVGSIP